MPKVAVVCRWPLCTGVFQLRIMLRDFILVTVKQVPLYVYLLGSFWGVCLLWLLTRI